MAELMGRPTFTWYAYPRGLSLPPSLPVLCAVTDSFSPCVSGSSWYIKALLACRKLLALAPVTPTRAVHAAATATLAFYAALVIKGAAVNGKWPQLHRPDGRAETLPLRCQATCHALCSPASTCITLCSPSLFRLFCIAGPTRQPEMFSNTVGSQLSVVPKGLPLLPGNGFKDPTLTDFKKSHVFDVHQGIPVSHDPTVAAPPATGTVEAPKMPPMPTADITPVQPAWVAFDRKVLRFNCFFKEAVNESRLENYRIRNCVLYYYLEDDSMHISEPKVENSGIPQVRSTDFCQPSQLSSRLAHPNSRAPAVP